MPGWIVQMYLYVPAAGVVNSIVSEPPGATLSPPFAEIGSAKARLCGSESDLLLKVTVTFVFAGASTVVGSNLSSAPVAVLIVIAVGPEEPEPPPPQPTSTRLKPSTHAPRRLRILIW